MFNENFAPNSDYYKAIYGLQHVITMLTQSKNSEMVITHIIISPRRFYINSKMRMHLEYKFYTCRSRLLIGGFKFRTPLAFSNSECELCNCHFQFGAGGGGTCQSLFFSIGAVDNSNTNYATITF